MNQVINNINDRNYINPKHVTNPTNSAHENRTKTMIGYFPILVNELLTTHYSNNSPKHRRNQKPRLQRKTKKKSKKKLRKYAWKF